MKFIDLNWCGLMENGKVNSTEIFLILELYFNFLKAPGSYWKAKEILAWLYNESPTRDTIVVNDRWGTETRDHHGDFFTGGDHFNPGVLQTHKFENCIPLDRDSWGYRENAKLEDYVTFHELIREVVTTVACNGNALINVGPTSRGIIHPIFVERLKELGRFVLKLNIRKIT